MSLLSMSFSAAILILVIVMIRRSLLHKLPKRTFLLLWGVALCRLLIPFTISSRLSIYSIANTIIGSFSITDLSLAQIPVVQSNIVVRNPVPLLLKAEQASLSPITVIWLIGFLAFALFFLVTHLRCLREYKMALPIHHPFIAKWQQEHQLRRTAEIRQSDQINTPLTYGILRPVVLLPKQTDWEDETRLRYVLAHEFTHVQRFDTFTKLIMVTALCIHWFNPFVWLMFVLLNRDIEISCDEAVIRSFGGSELATYALTLIAMEEKKSYLAPLANHFCKCSMEERVRSIMNYKKTSLFTRIASIGLVAVLITAFATSAQANENKGFHAAIPLSPVLKTSNPDSSFLFDKVELYYYDNGCPYLHDIKTNNTSKTIIEMQYGMLGYDKLGNPLQLQWNFLDSSSQATYDYLVKEESELLPKQTLGVNGGWSLYDSETMDWPQIPNAGPNKVAYALFEIKEIHFADGSVWNNKAYNTWLEAYKGRAVDVSIFKSYYPREIKITE